MKKLQGIWNDDYVLEMGILQHCREVLVLKDTYDAAKAGSGGDVAKIKKVLEHEIMDLTILCKDWSESRAELQEARYNRFLEKSRESIDTIPPTTGARVVYLRNRMYIKRAVLVGSDYDVYRIVNDGVVALYDKQSWVLYSTSQQAIDAVTDLVTEEIKELRVAFDQVQGTSVERRERILSALASYDSILSGAYNEVGMGYNGLQGEDYEYLRHQCKLLQETANA